MVVDINRHEFKQRQMFQTKMLGKHMKQLSSKTSWLLFLSQQANPCWATTARRGRENILFPNRKACCAMGSRCVNSTPSRKASTCLCCDMFSYSYIFMVSIDSFEEHSRGLLYSDCLRILYQGGLSGRRWEISHWHLGVGQADISGRRSQEPAGFWSKSRPQNQGLWQVHQKHSLVSGNRPASHFLSTRTRDQKDKRICISVGGVPSVRLPRKLEPGGKVIYKQSNSHFLRVRLCAKKHFHIHSLTECEG